MIVQGLVSVAASWVSWLAGLFPSAPDLASTIAQTNSQWSALMTSFVGLGAWVDWAFVLSLVGLVGSVYLVMFGAKVVRAIASYIPFVGGAG